MDQSAMSAIDRNMLIEAGPTRLSELHCPVTLVADRTQPSCSTDRSCAGKHGNPRHVNTAIRPVTRDRVHEQLAGAPKHTLTCRMGEQAARRLAAIERRAETQNRIHGQVARAL